MTSKDETSKHGQLEDKAVPEEIFARPTNIGKADEFLPSPAILPEREFKGSGVKGIYAIDCGGSLVKVVYSTFEKIAGNDANAKGEARLNFRKFQEIEESLEFIKMHAKESGIETIAKPIPCTGGGAFKYGNVISSVLDSQVTRVDEMTALVTGCNFLLKHIENESFTYHHEAESDQRYQYMAVDPSAMFPYQLVNIGTGSSVIKVESETKFSRIGGSTLGGGAFTGIGLLLTHAKSFDELLLLAEGGNHRNVDLFVSDIYAGPYEDYNLPADLIAASFGRCMYQQRRNAIRSEQPPTEGDLVKSLLLLLSNSIGQMATLYGRLNNVKTIYFGGYFIRNHSTTMRTISFAVNYWSKGEIQAVFLRHEGYVGAVGAFLRGAKMHDIFNDSTSDQDSLKN